MRPSSMQLTHVEKVKRKVKAAIQRRGKKSTPCAQRGSRQPSRRLPAQNQTTGGTTFTFSCIATAIRAASASLPSICDPSDPRQISTLSGCASATPFTYGHMCPSRPDAKCTPGVTWLPSGCPGSPAWPLRYDSSCSAGRWPLSAANRYCVATRCPASTTQVQSTPTRGTFFKNLLGGLQQASSNSTGMKRSGADAMNASSTHTSGTVSKAPPVCPP